MGCDKCGRKAGNKILEKIYCSKHFMEIIEKRVRKHLRTTQKIDIRKEYYFAGSKGCEQELAKYFLEKIFRGILKLKIIKASRGIPEEQVIVPETLDETAKEYLETFFEDKDFHNSKIINPLGCLLESEALQACKILGIKHEKKKKGNYFLDKMEEKYPGSKFSIGKSMKEIGKK